MSRSCKGEGHFTPHRLLRSRCIADTALLAADRLAHFKPDRIRSFIMACFDGELEFVPGPKYETALCFNPATGGLRNVTLAEPMVPDAVADLQTALDTAWIMIMGSLVFAMQVRSARSTSARMRGWLCTATWMATKMCRDAVDETGHGSLALPCSRWVAGARRQSFPSCSRT